jgi:hypothetical protein
MTDLQKKLVELDKKKEDIKKYYEELQETLTRLKHEFGTNIPYFMDGDGTVYGVAEAEGRYVRFDKYEYVRTKRPGEEKGTLSIKKAQELGFPVSK